VRSAGRSDDAGVASGETKLSHIDEHAIVIAAGDPGRVWNALGETIERYWRVPNLGVRMLRAEPATRSGDPLITGSTIPGPPSASNRPTDLHEPRSRLARPSDRVLLAGVIDAL
jgi:hypothetical protein